MANYNSAYTGAQIDAAIGAVANKSDIGHTHTVDDIEDFPAISGDSVGDIKISIRTDLGENWLLCNGDTFDEVTYPDLFDFMPDSTPAGIWTQISISSANLLDITYANGYWVAVGSNGALYYKEGPELSGTWTANNQGSANLNAVVYANGYWVAVGTGGALYYKAGTPDGAWTQNNQGTQDLRGLTYANDYWVAVGTSGTLYYKADTPNGAWTANNQDGYTMYSVSYANGYWVAAEGSGYIHYKSGTAPTGSWTQKYILEAQNFLFVTHANGYWVLGAANGNNCHCNASTPNNNWTRITKGGTNIRGIAYANGYWVFVGGAGFLKYSTELAGGTENNQGSADLRAVRYINGYWVVVGYSGALYCTKKHLPVMSFDNAYVYIRAK
jgi:hypothetical protein